ncbi:prenyltransferase/squalene oxidase repeat-containing protein, partial [Actinomycetota bacterium]
KKDLLKHDPGDIHDVWRLKEAQSFVRNQKEGGWWKYPGKGEDERFPEDYIQIETYRILGFLIEKYGFDYRSQVIKKAAEFLFRCQKTEGDFRGIYGNQYSPNYSSAILELLIRAGYHKDKRVLRGLDWLLSMRQEDGGWAIPFRTINNRRYTEIVGGDTLKTDRSKPFSHFVTGVVLRSFAAHPDYRNKKEILNAGKLLISRMFEKDKYPDRNTPDFWEKFSYPFWQTDLLSTLDSVSSMGFSTKIPKIKKAIEWIIARQQNDGLWRLKLLKTRYRDQVYWITLAICRVFKKFYQDNKYD